MTDDEHYFCVEDTNVPNLNLNLYLPLLVPWRPLRLQIPQHYCCAARDLPDPPLSSVSCLVRAQQNHHQASVLVLQAECFHLFSPCFSICQGLKTSKAPALHRVFILIDTALTLVLSWLALELLDLNGPQEKHWAYLLPYQAYHPDSLQRCLHQGSLTSEI